MASRWRMSATQMVALTTLLLSAPHSPSSRSISLRICCAWPLASCFGSSATTPAVNTKPLASTTFERIFDGSWRWIVIASLPHSAPVIPWSETRRYFATLQGEEPMKIDAVELTLFAWDDIPPTRYTQGTHNTSRRSNLGVLRIKTDDGIEGHAFPGSTVNPAATEAGALIRSCKPAL